MTSMEKNSTLREKVEAIQRGEYEKFSDETDAILSLMSEVAEDCARAVYGATHDPKDAGYCDTGADVDYRCRSECAVAHHVAVRECAKKYKDL